MQKWNGVGTVRLYELNGDTTIEVRDQRSKITPSQVVFHDTSVHSEMLLPNTETEYCMADVCEAVVALANRKGRKEQR